jgi:hypothetical protein
MKDSGQQIAEWLRVDAAQAPLLVVGQQEEILHKLVEDEIIRSITDGLVAVNDVVRVVAKNRVMSIKQIRNLMSLVQYKPLKTRRIFYIRNVHHLRPAGANALLKTLEDASSAIRFILTTPWPGRLLITVRSRCQRLSINKATETLGVKTKPAKPVESLLANLNRVDALDEDGIAKIADQLGQELKDRGPSQELKLLMLRLIDYYRIKEKNGNEKLAKEVLLAHLVYRENKLRVL